MYEPGVHVVITYVHVPVHFLNLNLSIEREQVKIFKDYLKVHTYRWERESWRVWLCKIKQDVRLYMPLYMALVDHCLSWMNVSLDSALVNITLIWFVTDWIWKPLGWSILYMESWSRAIYEID